MITNISTDNYNVLESNIVYLPDEHSDLILHFRFEENFEFDFKFIFKSDSEDTNSRLERKQNENILEAICVNFDNILGTGTSEPLSVATINGKQLYIHFWSFLLGNSEGKKRARKVEYTVLIER